MRVRTFGSSGAAPVVLVHGLGMSSLYLIPTAIELAGEFEVLIPEFPGFGRSERPFRSHGVPELADLLAEFLDTLGHGPVPLLGNSVGCQILVDLAMRHPERVDRLVLVGPTFDPGYDSYLQQAGRLLLDAFREAPSLVPVAVYDYLRTGAWRFWKTFKHAFDDPIETKLAHVPQPVLVVRGERDPIVTQRWAEQMVQLLPRGRLEVIPGAPHGANFSTAPDLARVIRPFLRGG
jgi:2-hydroxy-6-oxonona-2,4-dienedioate hydrolase